MSKNNIVSYIKEVFNMDIHSAYNRAKEMLIDGATYDEIKSCTGLREKEIKRIRRNEIDSHF